MSTPSCKTAVTQRRGPWLGVEPPPPWRRAACRSPSAPGSFLFSDLAEPPPPVPVRARRDPAGRNLGPDDGCVIALPAPDADLRAGGRRPTPARAHGCRRSCRRGRASDALALTRPTPARTPAASRGSPVIGRHALAPAGTEPRRLSRDVHEKGCHSAHTLVRCRGGTQIDPGMTQRASRFRVAAEAGSPTEVPLTRKITLQW